MTHPNIVVVVMDCVRASDFPGGADAVAGMPCVEQLRKESVQFPRAAAVAPWTIPSHATMFTGLYPWEHGDHGRGSLVLDPNCPTLANLLRPFEYRSASFSANSLVCPATGLVNGFDFAAWGRMSDLFLRTDHREVPPRTHSAESTELSPAGSDRRTLLSRLPFDEIPIRSLLERHIEVPAWGAQLLEKIRGCGRNDTFDVARWIEPSLDRFVRTVPGNRPLFCFLNLLDAHEPYFPYSEVLRSHGGTGGFGRLRQDREGWFELRRARKGWDLTFLHDLYRAAIQRMDRRIARIIEILKSHGRWDNTLFVLTSDHGQAFGEKGILFHRFRVDDALIRIPLLVRMPQRTFAGATGTGWASLVDIVPTCLDLVDHSASPRLSGQPLGTLIEAPRPGPVLALHDGTIGDRWVPESRRPELERIAVAAFQGDTKVVVQFSPRETHAFSSRLDPQQETDVWDPTRPDQHELADRAARIGQTLEVLPKQEIDAAVQYRLESWGYI